ncbi:MAG: isocitrate/isopropylmalate dehydrogenase family protein, partial [Rhizobiaceae bacterium]|nr:isocitrate/isopropylmalate family dehydrogenase [Hyphomicrobiales bacterium]NRB33050.1 isocitrate/isopropylmalate dehydrogenase family protein [Rhizobiaceae bacterium]
MKQPIEIAVFEGDGIGPEIMRPTVELLEQLGKSATSYALNFNAHPAGAAHYAESGVSLPQASLEAAKAADAILLSAMGLPSVRYPDGTEISPQIELRKEMNLYAGVRPVRVTSGQNSPLKLPKGTAIDFVLIRESTEGLFWSQGRGEVCETQASERLVISKDVSEKLFRFSFNLAEHRKRTGRGKGQVTCVDKANVFRAFAYFRDLFDMEAACHPQLGADH